VESHDRIRNIEGGFGNSNQWEYGVTTIYGFLYPFVIGVEIALSKGKIVFPQAVSEVEILYVKALDRPFCVLQKVFTKMRSYKSVGTENKNIQIETSPFSWIVNLELKKRER
jgi:hypothetical protein